MSSSAIGFATTILNNASLEQGKTTIVSPGQKGKKETTYEITYKDGKEVSRKTIASTIVQQPITREIHKGTKIPQPNCPNGSYVNTRGNVVCRPVASNSAPAGATAKCVDGTYSFS